MENRGTARLRRCSARRSCSARSSARRSCSARSVPVRASAGALRLPGGVVRHVLPPDAAARRVATFGCQAAEFGKAFLLGGGHCTLMRKDLLQLGSAKFAPVALLDDAVEVVFHQYLNPAEQGEELGKHEVIGNSAMQGHQLPFATVEDTGIVDDFQHFPAAGKRCAGIGKGTEPLPVLANVGCPHRVAPRKAEYRIKVVPETVGATAGKTFVVGVAALYGASSPSG